VRGLPAVPSEGLMQDTTDKTTAVDAPPCAAADRNTELRQRLPLVKTIARRVRARMPAHVALDELVQAGVIGLDQALDHYDATRGTHFGSYACRRIEGAMLDTLRANDLLSRPARSRLRHMQAAVQRLEQRLGRTPRAREVALELGWTLQAFHDCLVSADAAGARGDDVALEHADDACDPARLLQQRQRLDALATAFAALDDRERFVMEGLHDHGLTLDEVGMVLGLSGSRISRMSREIIAKLNRRLRLAGH
jgi:RNA polymerase sigma factor for flagellar operon FliA